MERRILERPPDLVAASPKTIWVELTSKCPFDCVFCSRKHERGNGQHLSFPLYESLIRQLRQPEIIRLNYSGESLHYPRLYEAIQLARQTEATTEIVSALGSATLAAVESLVDAGLHRLSVSIHTMDAAQFRNIYRKGELADIRERLDHLEKHKAKTASKYPEVDFAFVAMHNNLSQLGAVAEYAQAIGVKHLSIHPVIRRADTLTQFPTELEPDGGLRGDFAVRVRNEADSVSARNPKLTIVIARPDHTNPGTQLGTTTCEQNPWDTVHVLADGGVVVCEVLDKVEIGNLHRQSLADIWNSPQYYEFRLRYANGAHTVCATCPWRRTYSALAVKKVLVRGWHPSIGEAVDWSAASAALAVMPRPGAIGIRLSGILPPPPAGNDNNSLRILPSCGIVTVIVNDTEDLLPFEVVLPPASVLRFETSHRFCPAERGASSDTRNLGYALTGFQFEYDESRKKLVSRLLDLLERAERMAAVWRRVVWRPANAPTPTRPGVSILVPARDTPDLLAPTLAAAQAAIERIDEPSQIVVVVSGAAAPASAALQRSFPSAKWVFRKQTLDYVCAVELGLAHSKYPWVYLLNSDMSLHSHALTEVLKLRRPDTFAVGSRIKMHDGTAIETNWTDLRYPEGDAAELIERDPGALHTPRGCLYAGGGSSLFRSSLLKKFIPRTRAYAPFYWEDVEWGAMAWRHGFHCTFCPTSQAVHSHRQTIARYYSNDEVSRVFERNRLLFHLRNLGRLHCIEERLLSLDPKSWADIFHPGVIRETAWARAKAFIAPHTEAVLQDRWRIEY